MNIIAFRASGDGRVRFGACMQEEIHEFQGDLSSDLLDARLTGQTFGMSDVNLLPSSPQPSKIICVGLNYADHAEEAGLPLPTVPLLFTKFPSALIPHGGTVRIPPFVQQPDWEAELAVIIGRECASVSEAKALDYVLGVSCFNDISARDIQSAESQWTRAKSFDSFAPLGPWITPLSDIPDIQDLRVSCRVEAEIVQNSTTSNMVFSVAEIISFISRSTTLRPGDVIATGTPPGVGVGRRPPRFLQNGETVEVEIEGVGVLSNTVHR